jgi:hypothetical protein
MMMAARCTVWIVAVQVDALEAERHHKVKTCILDGLEDHETFWDILEGDKSAIKSQANGGPDDVKADDFTPKIYKYVQMSTCGSSVMVNRRVIVEARSRRERQSATGRFSPL